MTINGIGTSSGIPKTPDISQDEIAQVSSGKDTAAKNIKNPEDELQTVDTIINDYEYIKNDTLMLDDTTQKPANTYHIAQPKSFKHEDNALVHKMEQCIEILEQLKQQLISPKEDADGYSSFLENTMEEISQNINDYVYIENDTLIINDPSISSPDKSSYQTFGFESGSNIPEKGISKPLAKVQEQCSSQIENCIEQFQILKENLGQFDEQKHEFLEKIMTGAAFAIGTAAGFKTLTNETTSTLDSVTLMLSTMAELQLNTDDNKARVQQAFNNMEEITKQAEKLARLQVSLSGVKVSDVISPDANLGDTIAALGNAFVGVINTDRQGNVAFSNGASRPWCVDFVTSVVKTAFEAKGEELPDNFDFSSVPSLLSWSKDNDSFIQTAGAKNKARVITENINPGDILIQTRGGYSHAGIVTKVYPDGSFDSVEGNTSNAVKNRHYGANDNKLTGFVKIT